MDAFDPERMITTVVMEAQRRRGRMLRAAFHADQSGAPLPTWRRKVLGTVKRIGAIVAAALLAMAPAAARGGGQELFEAQCSSCHTLNGHSTASGPSLKGVAWRKIASLKDFRYSAGLEAKTGTWSPDRLDAYLRDTQAFAPGTDMFWEITDAAERKALVDFLERQ